MTSLRTSAWEVTCNRAFTCALTGVKNMDGPGADQESLLLSENIVSKMDANSGYLLSISFRMRVP